jgi:DNA-binding NarL/FixJ family response regulator
MPHSTRILIVDDDRRTRAGLRALLGTCPSCEIVGEASDGEEALAHVERCHPDVVILDVQMPILDGIAATRQIKRRWPQVTILVLTMDPGHRSAALEAGADAFVSKADGAEQVLITLRTAHGREGGSSAQCEA